MSVVDQSVWLAGGPVRRLLLRAALVLGGAVVATLFGWLVNSGAASADAMPSVPRVLDAVQPKVSVVDVADVPGVSAAHPLASRSGARVASVGTQAVHVTHDRRRTFAPRPLPVSVRVRHCLPARHSPSLPPWQPTGSSDSSSHDPGGVAGGPGPMHTPLSHVTGIGLAVGRPSHTPRPASAPGQQPGISPD